MELSRIRVGIPTAGVGVSTDRDGCQKQISVLPTVFFGESAAFVFERPHRTRQLLIVFTDAGVAEIPFLFDITVGDARAGAVDGAYLR
jgi:hypothetical protein